MKKKYSYIQDWGSFPNETYIVVGMTHQEILKNMTKRHFNKEDIKAYDTALSNSDHYQVSAFVYRTGGKTVLWIDKWDGSWDDCGILVHETNHLIHFVLCENKGMETEIEAKAYQQQYLFENISRVLNKQFKIKGLTKLK